MIVEKMGGRVPMEFTPPAPTWSGIGSGHLGLLTFPPVGDEDFQARASKSPPARPLLPPSGNSPAPQ
jgi:hypothetical protein